MKYISVFRVEISDLCPCVRLRARFGGTPRIKNRAMRSSGESFDSGSMNSSQVVSSLRRDFWWWIGNPIYGMLHVWNIYTYIYHKNGPNVGKYSIHGASGYGMFDNDWQRSAKSSWWFKVKKITDEFKKNRRNGCPLNSSSKGLFGRVDIAHTNAWFSHIPRVTYHRKSCWEKGLVLRNGPL